MRAGPGLRVYIHRDGLSVVMRLFKRLKQLPRSRIGFLYVDEKLLRCFVLLWDKNVTRMFSESSFCLVVL